MRIGVDCDGVLYDFRAASRAVLIERARIPWDAPTSGAWDFYKDWGIGEDEWVDLLSDPDAYRHGPLIEGAAEGVARLRDDGHTVHCITHRPACVSRVTSDWLGDNGLKFHSVSHSSDKTLHRLDLLIDDSPTVIEQCRAAGMRAVTFDQPWNRHLDGPRMKGWADLGLVA